MKVIKLYPRFFSTKEGNEVGKAITLKEIEGVLKGFARDKNPGPDGWPVEFFLEFFEIMGEDLLSMLEEFMNFGKI